VAPVTFWLLGVVLGMRHAFEPDHLAAVSTLVGEERGARRAAMLGALWGLGHAAALLIVGVVLAIAEARMPARLADLFELGVACMLVVLGARALRRAARDGGTGAHSHHAHGLLMHAHVAPPDHVHLGRWTFARRSLLVGVMHGLAGSGSLTALVVANLPSAWARLAYVLLFAAGSIGGMALLSGVAGWPLRKLARHPWAIRSVAAGTGLVSIVVGAMWAYPVLGRLAG
jgi:ABC-type nickel/cobalt efflux system permease component RcnA